MKITQQQLIEIIVEETIKMTLQEPLHEGPVDRAARAAAELVRAPKGGVRRLFGDPETLKNLGKKYADNVRGGLRGLLRQHRSMYTQVERQILDDMRDLLKRVAEHVEANLRHFNMVPGTAESLKKGLEESVGKLDKIIGDLQEWRGIALADPGLNRKLKNAGVNLRDQIEAMQQYRKALTTGTTFHIDDLEKYIRDMHPTGMKLKDGRPITIKKDINTRLRKDYTKQRKADIEAKKAADPKAKKKAKKKERAAELKHQKALTKASPDVKAAKMNRRTLALKVMFSIPGVYAIFHLAVKFLDWSAVLEFIYDKPGGSMPGTWLSTTRSESIAGCAERSRKKAEVDRTDDEHQCIAYDDRVNWVWEKLIGTIHTRQKIVQGGLTDKVHAGKKTPEGKAAIAAAMAVAGPENEVWRQLIKNVVTRLVVTKMLILLRATGGEKDEQKNLDKSGWTASKNQFLQLAEFVYMNNNSLYNPPDKNGFSAWFNARVHEQIKLIKTSMLEATEKLDAALGEDINDTLSDIKSSPKKQLYTTALNPEIALEINYMGIKLFPAQFKKFQPGEAKKNQEWSALENLVNKIPSGDPLGIESEEKKTEEDTKLKNLIKKFAKSAPARTFEYVKKLKRLFPLWRAQEIGLYIATKGQKPKNMAIKNLAVVDEKQDKMEANVKRGILDYYLKTVSTAQDNINYFVWVADEVEKELDYKSRPEAARLTDEIKDEFLEKSAELEKAARTAAKLDKGVEKVEKAGKRAESGFEDIVDWAKTKLKE